MTEQRLREKLDIVTDERDIARFQAEEFKAKFEEWQARARLAEQKLVKVAEIQERLFLDLGRLKATGMETPEGNQLFEKVALDVGRLFLIQDE